MISFDANLAVYAANVGMPEHGRSRAFIESLGSRQDVVVAEVMLVELYLKLRNRAIFPTPFTAREAVNCCGCLRSNTNWELAGSAPVLDEVWKMAKARDFAFRRIIDLRLGLTLRHHRVTEFATANVKDFRGLGFKRVWNPLKE